MKALLLVSCVLVILASFVFWNHQASAVPISYNTNIPVIPWTQHARSTFETFVSSANDGVISQWFEANNTNDYVLMEKKGIPTPYQSGPILIDNTQNKDIVSSTNATQFVAMTINQHDNRTLVVTIGFCSCTGTETDHNHIISSVSFNGIALTRVLNNTATDTSSVYDSEIWYLVNPPVSTGHIIITPVAPGNTYNIQVVAFALYNVLTTSPIGITNSNTNVGTPFTVSITPTTQHSWVITSFEERGANPSIVPRTDVTSVTIHDAGGAGGSQYREVPSIANLNTFSWDTSSLSTTVTTVAEIKPAFPHINFLYLSGPLSSKTTNLVANGSKIYYTTQVFQDNVNYKVDHIDSLTNVALHDFSISTTCPTITSLNLFLTTHDLLVWCISGGSGSITTKTGNQTGPGFAGFFLSNQKIGITNNVIRANFNDTTPRALNSNLCELLYLPDNSTTKVPDIGCDTSIPMNVPRYFNGLNFVGVNGYRTNSTLLFLNSIIHDTNVNLLTLPTQISGVADPSISFRLHNSTNDYIIAENSNNVYYLDKTAFRNVFGNNNYAIQSYFTIYENATTLDNIPKNLINTLSWKLYSGSTNVTTSRYGVVTLPSSHTMKGSSLETTFRTIDPRWTNDAQVYPYLVSTGSLFPISLTVTNAPIDSAIKITNPQLVINNLESLWAVAFLPTTHNIEIDLPTNKCASVYIADISKFPSIWNFQGSICATGNNQQTIAYTTTLPFTFYTMKFGATHTYTPANNGLSTTVRSSTAPLTYNVIVKNSTGAIAINQTFTVNSTIDTRTYNVSSVTKPAGLFITAGGNEIYSAYLGSSLSLATAASFFHQYLNYQGFDFLSFIPLIFASMFTRNTVGIGASLTVVLIATLSWLSIVVISDTIVFIMIIIAAIGLIGYRGLYG